MTETLDVPENASREDVYVALLPQIRAVIDGVDDLIANLANVSAILKTAFNFHWVGFYRTTAKEVLTLGPFQGPLACVSIPFSKGVCGKAATEQVTVLVPDITQFPAHIACSTLTKSEIVVPLVVNGETQLVLDVDSDTVNDFNAIDQSYLEQIVAMIGVHHF